MNPSSTGLLLDNRTPEQKQYDIKFSEVFGSPAPTPSYLPAQPLRSTYQIYPWENQLLTSGCVPHSRALNIAIYRTLKKSQPFVQLSPMFVYRNRINYPSPGMNPNDANYVTIKLGIPEYADLPTPATEAEANEITIPPAVTEEALENTVGQWATADDPSNIDNIAYVTNILGIPASILIFGTIEEWSMESPQIINPTLTIQEAEVAHDVTVLPNTAYIDPTTGKKFVIIQDSAFFGGLVYRFVSEDFINLRCQGTDCIISLGNNPPVNQVPYTFSVDLGFGSTGADVLAVQKSLQNLGFFPNIVNGNEFACTEYYGGMTKLAVLAFQNAYKEEILVPEGMTVGNGVFGPNTRAFLNKLINPTSTS